MKKIIFILLILSIHLAAQDTIRFKNGEIKAVKVSEVGLSEIKYNMFNNSDGPVYIVSKNDITSIKYLNGHIDNFAVVNSVNPAPSVTTIRSTEDRIDIMGKKLFYNGSRRQIGESRLNKMVNLCQDVAKQNKMIPVLEEMKSYRKKQYAVGFSCMGVGIGVAYVGFMGGLISEDPAFFVGIPVGAAIGIAGAVVSSVMKRKRNEKKLEVARIYNGEK